MDDTSLLDSPPPKSPGSEKLKNQKGWPRLRASINVFACTVSGGLVALPKSFNDATLWVGVGLCAIAGITTALSLHVLTLVSQRTANARSYGEVTAHMFGPFASQMMNAVIGFFLTGVLAGSFLVLRDIFVVLGAGDLLSKGLVLIVAACVMLLAMPKKIGMLSMGSTFSLVAFSCLAGLLVVLGVSKMISAKEGQKGPPWLPGPETDYRVIGSSFPVIVFACGCQFQLPDIFQNLLETRPTSGFNRSFLETLFDGGADTEAAEVAYFVPVVLGSCLPMFALFSLVGVFGCCAFPGQTIQPDVLKMLGDGPDGVVAHVALALALMFSAPLLVHPARGSIMGLVLALTKSRDTEEDATVTESMVSDVEGGGPTDHKRQEQEGAEENDEEGEETKSNTVHFVVTVAVVAIAAIVAITIRDVMVVFSFLGAFLCAPLFVIFPAAVLLWLVWTGSTPGKGQVGCGAIGACIWLIVVGTGTGVVSIKGYFN